MHVTMIENTPDGHLGKCDTCGHRNDRFTGYGEAMQWCDEHELKGHLRLDSRPSLRTLEKWYRGRAEVMTYTPAERMQWLQLADELSEEIEARATRIIPGQMELWPETQGETA